MTPETIDLTKIGAGKVWHHLTGTRHVEETAERLAYVEATGLCGQTGELTSVARDLDPNVIRYDSAGVCSRCIHEAATASGEARLAALVQEGVAKTHRQKEQDMTTDTTTKVSSREAIRLAFQNDLGLDAEAKTADICEQAAKYATSLGFNPRHQLEATLHAQARKDDGVVVRAGRGTFRLRTETAAPAVEEPTVEQDLADAVVAATAKPDPKPTVKKRKRAAAKS